MALRIDHLILVNDGLNMRGISLNVHNQNYGIFREFNLNVNSKKRGVDGINDWY